MRTVRLRPAGRYLAGVAISALLLLLVLRQVDREALVRSAKTLGATPLALAVLGMAFCFFVGTVRVTTAVARVSGVSVRLSEVIARWFPMTLATVLLGHVVSIAGDAVRLPHMGRQHRLKLSVSIALLAFDRVVGFGGALLLALLSSTLILGLTLPGPFAGGLLLLTGLFAVVALVGFVPRAARRVLEHPLLRALLGVYFGSARRVGEQIAIVVLACGGIALAVAAVAAAIGADVPAGIAFAAAPIIYCGASIPFTFAGWGSRELSTIAALSWSGWTTTSDAVLVSLAIGVATLIASLPGAGFLWVVLGEARGKASSREDL